MDRDHEVWPLKHLHQAIKKPFVIMRPWLEIFLEYPLGGAHGFNRQLLIGH
jgi:hypothetical protein